MVELARAPAARDAIESLLTEALRLTASVEHADAVLLDEVMAIARDLARLRDQAQNWALIAVIHDLRTAREVLMSGQARATDAPADTPHAHAAATRVGVLLAHLGSANDRAGLSSAYREAVELAVRDLTHLRAATNDQQLDDPLASLTAALASHASAAAGPVLADDPPRT